MKRYRIFRWHEVLDSEVPLLGHSHCRREQPEVGIQRVEPLSYDEKLITALSHFEPETPIRAAEILSARKVIRALEPLKAAFCSRGDLDPFMGQAFLRAIATIAGESECEVARELLKRSTFASPVAEDILRKALKPSSGS